MPSRQEHRKKNQVERLAEYGRKTAKTFETTEDIKEYVRQEHPDKTASITIDMCLLSFAKFEAQHSFGFHLEFLDKICVPHFENCKNDIVALTAIQRQQEVFRLTVWNATMATMERMKCGT